MQARETIMQALFALVSGSASFITKSRRLQLWSSLSPAREASHLPIRAGRRLHPRKELHNHRRDERRPVHLHCSRHGHGVTPISMLDPLLDAVDAALAPNIVTRRQTLGGLVSHVWIDGKIMKDPGDIDGDGIAVIPVKILATV